MKSRSSKNPLQIPPRGTHQYIKYLEAIETNYLELDEAEEYEAFLQEEKDYQTRTQERNGLRNRNNGLNLFSSLFT